MYNSENKIGPRGSSVTALGLYMYKTIKIKQVYWYTCTPQISGERTRPLVLCLDIVSVLYTCTLYPAGRCSKAMLELYCM